MERARPGALHAPGDGRRPGRRGGRARRAAPGGGARPADGERPHFATPHGRGRREHVLRQCRGRPAGALDPRRSTARPFRRASISRVQAGLTSACEWCRRSSSPTRQPPERTRFFQGSRPFRCGSSLAELRSPDSKETTVIDAYQEHEAERKALGIPAKPLDPEQTRELCKLLENPPAGKEAFLLALLENRVSPGVDPAAEVKASFLADVVNGKRRSPLISKKDAVRILGTMMGGYNVGPLVGALSAPELAEDAVRALAFTTQVYDSFDAVVALSKANPAARKVLESWAKAEWFTSRPGVPSEVTAKVFKVEGEINTDDFSPAGDASTRPDIPLHALAMGKTRFPDGLAAIAKSRAEGFQVAFVGDVVGTGSSRKSACNSVLWHIGEDIPFVPNKRRNGIILGGVIAPIFFNTAQDSGALPVKTDVTKLKTGDVVVIDTKKGEVRTEAGEVLSTFKLAPNTLADEYRAGRRSPP